jgi:alpha-beta hydrolase superfamily lysophospholipase
VDVSPGAKLAIAAARLFCPGRHFEIPLNDPALFTDNPAMREYLRADPHRLHTATARFLVASAVLDRLIARAEGGALAMPTTLVLAKRDRIINTAATRAAVERLTAGAARIVELDAAHTLEFEPDPTAFHGLLCEAVR